MDHDDADIEIPQQNAELYLIGLGVSERNSLTPEAIAMLRRCRVVFTGSRAWTDFLKRYCADVRVLEFDITARDSNRAIRTEIEPIFSALSDVAPVAFVCYGHPMFYDAFCESISEACLKREVSMAIVSGVSACDAVLSTLGVSLSGYSGLQIGDLEFLSRNPPNPRSWVLVFRHADSPALFSSFVRACLKVYPKNHRVAFVRAWACSSMPESVSWHELQNCKSEAGALLPRSSIMIPPLFRRRRR